MSMKKELRDKWVAALRSGEYKQGRKYLHDKVTGGYCCLGVLCDVSDHPLWNGTTMNGNTHVLGDRARRDFGLIGFTGVLMDMNDIHRNTFSEIADYIEQNIPVEGE